MKTPRPSALRICAPAAWILLVGALRPMGSVGGPGPPQRTDLPPAVALAESCAPCHAASPTAGAMRDASGRSVAPFDLWSSSMMANAARDPFWRAVMSAEVATFPGRRREIEAKCLRCHSPVADRLGLDDHGTESLAHVLVCEGDLGRAARDGVSCTICHGMSPEGLGTPASYTGRFELDRERRLFGPHADPATGPMRMHTAFTPAHGAHVTRAALCATCHTLVTHTLDAQGSETGHEFLEQAPYLEWRNSAFDLERAQPGPRAASCQDCHLPTTDADGAPLATPIAHNPGGRDFPFLEPRAPYGRHLLAGGNVLVLGLFRDHGAELGVQASPAAFAATLAVVREQLATRTARVSVSELQSTGLAGGATRLSFRVHVENLTGHKFPTGHPSRRAWLHVAVRDAAGRELFASGGWDESGRIVGADGLPLATELTGGPAEPHRDLVRAADEVARFRAVMADVAGAPTHRLLAGASHWVDDRLLPAGWSPTHADAAATRPVGIEGDRDFAAGGDSVHYDIEVAGRASEVRVELCYQPVSPRWVAELAPLSTPEIERFLALWETAERAPVVVAAARTEVLP